MPSTKEILKELSLLKPVPPQHNFEYTVGNFFLQIYSNYNNNYDKILDHKYLDVIIFETRPLIYNLDKGRFYINPEIDFRFKKYEPIKYADWPGASQGQNMPLDKLIELIKYLYAIPKLLIFS